jgi:hypothetical protein
MPRVLSLLVLPPVDPDSAGGFNSEALHLPIAVLTVAVLCLALVTLLATVLQRTSWRHNGSRGTCTPRGHSDGTTHCKTCRKPHDTTSELAIAAQLLDRVPPHESENNGNSKQKQSPEAEEATEGSEGEKRRNGRMSKSRSLRSFKRACAQILAAERALRISRIKAAVGTEDGSGRPPLPRLPFAHIDKSVMDSAVRQVQSMSSCV